MPPSLRTSATSSSATTVTSSSSSGQSPHRSLSGSSSDHASSDDDEDDDVGAIGGGRPTISEPISGPTISDPISGSSSGPISGPPPHDRSEGSGGTPSDGERSVSAHQQQSSSGGREEEAGGHVQAGGDGEELFGELFGTLAAALRETGAADAALIRSLETEADQRREALRSQLESGGELPPPRSLVDLQAYVDGLARVSSKLEARASMGRGVTDWRGHADRAAGELARWRERLEEDERRHTGRAVETAARFAAARGAAAEWLPLWGRRVSEWLAAEAPPSAIPECPSAVVVVPRGAAEVGVSLRGNTFASGGALKLPCPHTADLRSCPRGYAVRRLVEAAERLLTAAIPAASLAEAAAALRERVLSLTEAAPGAAQGELLRFLCGPVREMDLELGRLQRGTEGTHLLAAYVGADFPRAAEAAEATAMALRGVESTAAASDLADVRFYSKRWRGGTAAVAVARDGPEAWEAGAEVEFWDGSAYQEGTVVQRVSASVVRVADADRPTSEVFLRDSPYFWPGPVQRRFLARTLRAYVEGLLKR